MLLLDFKSIQIGKDSDGIFGLTQAACHGPDEPLFCYEPKNGIDLWQLTYYKLQYRGDAMITLRLDPKLEQSVNKTAKNLGLTKSELIRKSIAEYIAKLRQPSPWETGHDLFGKYASGRSDLSSGRKELIKDKIRAKRT